VRDRRLLLAFLVVAPVAGIASAVVWQAPPGWFLVVFVAYAAAHLAAVPTPAGRHVPFVPAVAAVTAILTDGSPVMVLGAAAASLPLGWLASHVRFGRRVVDDAFPAQQAGLLAFGAVFAAITVPMAGPVAREPAALAGYTLACVAWFGVAAAVRAMASEQGRFTARRLVVARGVGEWPAYIALFASAALFAFTVGTMGVWAVPLAGLPYAFGHVSLSRVQATDRTYRETMLALSRIPEAGGLVASGHAERCSRLVVAVGAELGPTTAALGRLEYAALLHDIGRVVLANPAVASGGYDLSDVSVWSSVIISETRHLEPVGEIVASQHEPYRRPGESRDESMPQGSQILRVVASYDGEINRGMSPSESLEHLHRGAAYDFDPEVVGALRKVLAREGVISG
jgi:hypothetical protein